MIENKIKFLQLQKINTNPGFIVGFNGPLLSKGGTQTQQYEDEVVSQINSAVETFNWTAPPRAKMAVSFRFFSNQHDPPEIYSLVKYYLDLLEGPVFKNDRQIQYLDASILRLSPAKSEESSSHFFVIVRRLSEYKRMLDLCAELDDFSQEINSPIIYHHLIDRKYWDDAEKQCDLLRCNRIMAYDVPHHKNPFLKVFLVDINKHHPLIFDFGSLPERGESKQFKTKIGSSLSQLISNILHSRKIFVPIEFDVQVPSGIPLAKDLDNLMVTICSEAKKHIIDSKVYINGYRVYIADRLDEDSDSGIQVKLLPPGEIEAYNDRIESSLESLEETLMD